MLIGASTQNNLPSSPTFKALRKEIIQFFNNSVIFIPGNGAAISLWEHDWGFGILRHRVLAIYSHTLHPEMTLQGYVQSQDANQTFRPNLTEEAQVEFQLITQWISTIALQPTRKDNLKWRLTDNGQYTVQSVYRTLKEGPCINTDVRHIWKIRAPPRMLIFGWLAWQNSILTHDNLKKRGLQIVTRCTLCREDAKTVRHLLKDCPYTTQVYNEMKANKPVYTWPTNPVINLLGGAQGRGLTGTQRSMILVMQFVIWRERCARSFTENTRTPYELVQDVLHEIQGTQCRTSGTGTTSGTALGMRHSTEVNNTTGE